MSQTNTEPRIIVVDDDNDIRNLYSFTLKKHGAQMVGTFSDGREVIEAFREDANLADIVIIDYRMPGLDGVNAGRIINEINPRVRLILISAFEILPSTEVFDQVLKKPISSKELIDAVTSSAMKQAEARHH